MNQGPSRKEITKALDAFSKAFSEAYNLEAQQKIVEPMQKHYCLAIQIRF